MWQDIKQLLLGGIGIATGLLIIVVCFEILIAMERIAIIMLN